MIRSMTGFGRGDASRGGFRVTVEARSVNHRFFDLKARIPPGLTSLEADIRKRIQKKVRRGRVEIFITIERDGDSSIQVEIDPVVVGRHLKAARLLQEEFGLEGRVGLQDVLMLPGAVKMEVDRNTLGGGETTVLFRALERALGSLDRMRRVEGMHLRRDLVQRLRRIRRVTLQIGRCSRDAPLRLARKLQQRVERILPDKRIEPARIAQEAAVLAEKTDITEELVRLDGHLDQAEKLLRGGVESPGKRLDFLMQEMHREASTVASKTTELKVSRAVVEIKAEVEKIREQVQNLE